MKKPETDMFGEVPWQYRGIGYAAQPGSGPDGKTCGDCLHILKLRHGTRYYFKCEIGHISHSASSDIRKSAPACHLFNAAEVE